MPRSHSFSFIELLLAPTPSPQEIESNPILSLCEECRNELHSVIGNAPPVITNEALKNASDKIADLMRKYGIKGIRESESQCPLACYFELKTKHPMLVKDDAIQIDERYKIVLGGPMHEFIQRFDRGEYPDLELSAN